MTKPILHSRWEVNCINFAEKLKGTFAYKDNVAILAMTRPTMIRIFKQFMAAVKKYNLILNYNKCFIKQNAIKLLGYVVRKGNMKPDLE